MATQEYEIASAEKMKKIQHKKRKLVYLSSHVMSYLLSINTNEIPNNFTSAAKAISEENLRFFFLPWL